MDVNCCMVASNTVLSSLIASIFFVLVFQFGFYTRAPVRQRLDPGDVVKVLDIHGNQKRRDNSKRLYVVADKFLDLWHRLSKCQYDRQRFRDGLYQFDSRF